MTLSARMREYEWVQKFINQKLSYIFVYGQKSTKQIPIVQFIKIHKNISKSSSSSTQIKIKIKNNKNTLQFSLRKN
jgi:hypothetical protein